jgi:hypothetical protein
MLHGLHSPFVRRPTPVVLHHSSSRLHAELTISRLLAFEGPNLLGPHPAVLLECRAASGQARRLREALKDAALRAGVVIGALDVGGEPLAAAFTTPTPALGAELARLVVAGLNAGATWDADEALWELARRRRAEAPPVAALQLIAEAGARGVPAFIHAGQLQLGYGARGRSLSLAALAGNTIRPDAIPIGPAAPVPQPAVQVEWERLGTIPVFAISGGEGRPAAARAIAQRLRARGIAAGLLESATFDAARALLADPSVEAAVIGLEPGDLARRGLPFERCAACALLGLPPPLPEFPDRAELARALGVPLLVTAPEGRAALAAGVPEIAALAAYAPCPVVWLTGGPEAAAALAEPT